MRRRALVVLLGLALGLSLGGSTRVPDWSVWLSDHSASLRDQLSQGRLLLACVFSSSCAVVSDWDSDGNIGDDVQAAWNSLIAGSPPPVVELWFKPQASRVTWNTKVRLCGDSSPPAGETVPDCTGPGAGPKVRLLNLPRAPILADCGAGDPDGGNVPGKVYPCLQIGDRMEGDQGASEAFARVEIPEQFDVDLNPSVDLSNFGVFWVFLWADGVVDSQLRVACTTTELGANQAFDVIGQCFWGSLPGSYLRASFSPASSSDLSHSGVVMLDGQMDGAFVEVWYVNTNTGGREMTYDTVTVGSGNGTLFYGPQDECDYGPDAFPRDGSGGYFPGTICSNFTIHVQIKTGTSSNVSGDHVVILDGTRIRVVGDCIANSTQTGSSGQCVKIGRGSLGVVDQVFLDLNVVQQNKRAVTAQQSASGLTPAAPTVTIAGRYETHGTGTSSACAAVNTGTATAKLIVQQGTTCRQTGAAPEAPWVANTSGIVLDYTTAIIESDKATHGAVVFASDGTDGTAACAAVGQDCVDAWELPTAADTTCADTTGARLVGCN